MELLEEQVVLRCHARHQSGNLGRRPWSSWTAVGAPIIFVGDQLSMPSQQRFGSDDGGDLLEEFPTDCLRSDRQSATLVIAETRSAVADLLPQNPVFLH